MSHAVALCIDDSVHPSFWGQTAVLDRLVCTFTGRISALGTSGGTCADRPVKPCDVHDQSTAQLSLQGQFSEIVDACGDLPNESILQVEFQGGCATRLSDSISGPSDHAELLSCIGKALDALHFACADDLDCASVERSTLR